MFTWLRSERTGIILVLIWIVLPEIIAFNLPFRWRISWRLSTSSPMTKQVLLIQSLNLSSSWSWPTTLAYSPYRLA